MRGGGERECQRCAQPGCHEHRHVQRLRRRGDDHGQHGFGQPGGLAQRHLGSEERRGGEESVPRGEQGGGRGRDDGEGEERAQPERRGAHGGCGGGGDERRPYSVTITATNADGTTSTTSFAVSFSDVAPCVAAERGSVSVALNPAATNTGTFSDFDDAVTITASTGSVSQVGSHSGTWDRRSVVEERSPYRGASRAADGEGTTGRARSGRSLSDGGPTGAAEGAGMSAAPTASRSRPPTPTARRARRASRSASATWRHAWRRREGVSALRSTRLPRTPARSATSTTR